MARTSSGEPDSQRSKADKTRRLSARLNRLLVLYRLTTPYGVPIFIDREREVFQSLTETGWFEAAAREVGLKGPDLEEVTQEAIVRVWQHIRAGRLHTFTRHYVRQAVRYAAIDFSRKRTRTENMLVESLTDEAQQRDGRSPEFEEAMRWIQEKLVTSTEQEQQIVDAYLCGETFEKIASDQAMSTSGVYRIYRKFVDRLSRQSGKLMSGEA